MEKALTARVVEQREDQHTGDAVHGKFRTSAGGNVGMTILGVADTL